MQILCEQFKQVIVEIMDTKLHLLENIKEGEYDGLYMLYGWQLPDQELKKSDIKKTKKGATAWHVMDSGS
jgi:hypothetical protein